MKLLKLLGAFALVVFAASEAQAQASIKRVYEFTTNECKVVTTDKMGTGVWQVTSVGGGATITWTVSTEDGSYQAVDAFTADAPSSAVNSTTATGAWSASVAGYHFMRACVTGYTSGTVRVIMSAVGTGGGGGGGGGGGAASVITSLEDGFGENVGDDANDAIRVNVVAGGTSGVQYTEADTDASITGTALLFEGAANTLLAAPGTTANGLLVDVSRVTGTVTVGATNLDVQIGGSDTVTVTATNLDVQSGGADLALQTAVDGLETLLNGGLPAALGANGGLKVENALADVADDAALSGGPNTVPIGCHAEASQVAVSADDDKSDVSCNLNGSLYVTPELGTAFGIYVEDAGETAGGNLEMVGTVRRDTAASSAGTTGDNATLNTDANGLAWTRDANPCSAISPTPYVFSISTATTTEITPSLAGASTNYYVCSINLVTAAANNVALVDDDSDGCGSVTSGLAGGTTAATGWNFAANGGLTLGNGAGTVAKTNGTNRVLCLVTSAATQLSGTIMAVAAP